MFGALLVCAIQLGGVTGTDLRARAFFDANNVKVGDPLILTVDFVGSAEFKDLHPPKLSRVVSARDWKVDDASAKTDTYRDARRLTYRVRPMRDGVVWFPSLEFAYQTPDGSPRVIRANEIPVHARAGAQVVVAEMEEDPNGCHMVIPGMVYITFPTEYGTLYSASEIKAIHDICRRHNLLLYVDGARLGYGLSAALNNVTLPFLASHCDCFYIGGTKVGALCGEAVVFPRGNAPKHFFTMIKQRGALLAKSRLVGAQFEALFTDNLYFEISQHAIAMATTMKGIFVKAGIKLWNNSPTNQVFVVLDKRMIDRLNSRGIRFELWEPISEEQTLCRFVTSWATRFEDLILLEKGLA